MFNFLSRSRASINSISIPTFGWEMQHDDAQKKLWVHPEEAVALSINFFDKKPDIPSLLDLKALRNRYRELATQAGGGIIDVYVTALHGFTAVKTILKIPQDPKGTTYLASLTFPFRDCSYVLKVQAMEVQEMGMRDTLVLDQLMESGEVKLTDQGLQGWMADPYDPDFKGGTLMNLSEMAIHDPRFPQHPLSLVRKWLALTSTGMKMGGELKKIARFQQ